MQQLLKPALFAFLFMFAPIMAINATAAQHKMKVTDLIVGNGDEATDTTRVSVHYTGWLMDGTSFDSSAGRKPFVFTLGGGQVIAGWDQGVKGMRVGGKRELIIPPHLAYGKRGAGAAIPPDATLRFEVELLAVAPPLFSNIDNKELAELLAKGVKIVDVRRPEEWQGTGVVEGSILNESFQKTGRLRRGFLEDLADSVDKDEPVILICRTGNRSAVLSAGLAERYGYSKIYNVTKGIEDWIKNGNAVVKP